MQPSAARPPPASCPRTRAPRPTHPSGPWMRRSRPARWTSSPGCPGSAPRRHRPRRRLVSPRLRTPRRPPPRPWRPPSPRRDRPGRRPSSPGTEPTTAPGRLRGRRPRNLARPPRPPRWRCSPLVLLELGLSLDFGGRVLLVGGDPVVGVRDRLRAARPGGLRASLPVDRLRSAPAWRIAAAGLVGARGLLAAGRPARRRLPTAASCSPPRWAPSAARSGWGLAGRPEPAPPTGRQPSAEDVAVVVVGVVVRVVVGAVVSLVLVSGAGSVAVGGRGKGRDRGRGRYRRGQPVRRRSWSRPRSSTAVPPSTACGDRRPVGGDARGGVIGRVGDDDGVTGRQRLPVGLDAGHLVGHDVVADLAAQLDVQAQAGQSPGHLVHRPADVVPGVQDDAAAWRAARRPRRATGGVVRQAPGAAPPRCPRRPAARAGAAGPSRSGRAVRRPVDG